MPGTAWIWRFKRRHGLRSAKVCGEKRDADADAAAEYGPTLTKLILDHEISLDAVYNADETGLVYKKTFSRTLLLKTEKMAAGKKVPKQRITIMTCANASGSHRLKPLVIGKYKNPRCFSKCNRNTLPCTYTHQPKAWMTEQLFTDWFVNDFVPQVKRSLKVRRLPSRALLLVDNCTAHREMDVDGIICRFLPPNTTSLIQPMDQGVIAAAKKIYIREFMLQMINRPDPNNVTVDRFIKNWDIKKTVMIFGQVWNGLTSKTLSNCWNKILKDYREQGSDGDGEFSDDDETELRVIDLATSDDFEAEVESWLEASDEIPSTELLDMESYLEDAANQDCSVSTDEEEEVTTMQPNGIYLNPTVTRETDLNIISKIEELMGHLSVKNYTSDNDINACLTIISKIQKNIYHDRTAQELLTKFFDRKTYNE